ncbi:cytoplasmic protein [Thermodesulfobacteriota bacterium]
MLGKDLILKNPLKRLAYKSEDILSNGGFGAILARAGVGKTALMVQFALNALLKRQNVLHVSLNDSVSKVSLWYDEVLRNMATHYQTDQIQLLKDHILKHRLIMTFKAADFNVQKFEERLTDLKEQRIFFPNMILVDGLIFDEAVKKTLFRLGAHAKSNAIRVWFAVRTHRHERPALNGIPTQLAEIDDLFEMVIQLNPEGKDVRLKVLKGMPVGVAACNGGFFYFRF